MKEMMPGCACKYPFVEKYAKQGVLRFYALSILCVTLQLVLFHLIAIGSIGGGLMKPAFLMRSAVDAAVLMLPILLLPAKWRRYAWSIVVLFTVWLLCQTWYSRIYHDLMNAASFFMVENVNGLLLQSTAASMRWVDIFYIVVPGLCYAYYRRFVRGAVRQQKRNVLVTCLLPALIVLVLVPAFLYLECVKEAKERVVTSFAGRFTEPTSVNSLIFVEHNGLLPWVLTGIWNSVKESEPLSVQDLQRIQSFVAEEPQRGSFVASELNKDKNLILIIVESLNSWVVDFRVAGKEVCPRLNAYCRDSSAVVCLNMFPQVHAGRSSDGHLMYNTGLLPVKTGATAVLWGEADYPSLAKSLPEYAHATFSCEDGKLWNQSVSIASYGYEKYYNEFALKDITRQERILDAELFAGAACVIDSMKQPFLAQVITIAMHQPFTLLDRKTWISQSRAYDTPVLSYLECVNYFDEALGKFIDHLKKTGVYDHSVIVIASDHDELCKNALERRDVVKDSDRYCVFLALNAGVSYRHDAVMGQIDVYPTLLHIMGRNGYWWQGLGRSVLQQPSVRSAVTIDGHVAGDARDAGVERAKKAWDVSNLMIVKRYFDSEYNQYRHNPATRR